MISESPLDSPFADTVAVQWHEPLAALLQSGEKTLATLATDLDERLVFASGLLALTDRRLLFLAGSGAAALEWPLRRDLRLATQDHAGIGSLTLSDSNSRLAVWRFTLGQGGAVRNLVAAFERRARPEAPPAGGPALAGHDEMRAGGPRADLARQPSARLDDLGRDAGRDDRESSERDADEQEEVVEEQAPSGWVLFRLWRFARPYRMQLLSGFLLTLAATAATLVPPYLT
ncbi:MAG: hypothetical protein ABIP08_07440, partial [Lautropia sp.]